MSDQDRPFDDIETSVAAFMFGAFDPSGYDWTGVPDTIRGHYLRGARHGIGVATRAYAVEPKPDVEDLVALFTAAQHRAFHDQSATIPESIQAGISAVLDAALLGYRPDPKDVHSEHPAFNRALHDELLREMPGYRDKDVQGAWRAAAVEAGRIACLPYVPTQEDLGVPEGWILGDLCAKGAWEDFGNEYSCELWHRWQRAVWVVGHGKQPGEALRAAIAKAKETGL